MTHTTFCWMFNSNPGGWDLRFEKPRDKEFKTALTKYSNNIWPRKTTIIKKKKILKTTAKIHTAYNVTVLPPPARPRVNSFPALCTATHKKLNSPNFFLISTFLLWFCNLEWAFVPHHQHHSDSLNLYLIRTSKSNFPCNIAQHTAGQLPDGWESSGTKSHARGGKKELCLKLFAVSVKPLL